MSVNTSTSTPQDVERSPFTGAAYSASFLALRSLAQELPVSQQMPRLLATLKQSNVMIVVGETGSGKTTQFPKAIVLEDANNGGSKRLALTQPRRLAAQLIAERIAAEMDEMLGGVVGVRYRDCNRTSADTRLEVITDGSLLAIAKTDPTLSAYSTIVIDEAHQHTVATDLLLGLLRGLAEKRKDDLQIVIMSATVDADRFLNYFPGSVLEVVSGRPYPITISYLQELPSDELSAIVETVLHVHRNGSGGNILVFAPGTREIFEIIKRVEAALHSSHARTDVSQVGELSCWPLHAKLALEQQDAAIEAPAPPVRHGRLGRKLIVATNIAETSITLTGVTHVIDSCKAKSKIWDPRTESWSLRELWISKAAAQQRAGRAGRTSPGMVWRMCTEAGFDKHLTDHSVPAILECDMLSECLHILQMGQSPVNFPYMIAPATETIIVAMEQLLALGAINYKGEMTDRGRTIARLPIDVCSAIVLMSAQDYNCKDGIISVVAMIEATEGGNNLFLRPDSSETRAALKMIRARFQHPTGDHLTLYNVYMAWRSACIDRTQEAFVKNNMLHPSVLRSADRLRLQIISMLNEREGFGLCSLDPRDLDFYNSMLKALATGYPLRVAKRKSISAPRTYETVRHGIPVDLMPSTILGEPSDYNEWVIYHEFHNSGNSNRTIRLVTGIIPEYLMSAAPVCWTDVEFRHPGHIQDGCAKVIARMTGIEDAVVRGGMPKPTAPPAPAPEL